MNEYSSRSHTIFRIVIESRERATPEWEKENTPTLSNHATRPNTAQQRKGGLGKSRCSFSLTSHFF